MKFNDDADDSGRTPARPLPARYVVPLPEGFEEEEGKVQDGGEAGGGGEAAVTGGRGSGGSGSGRGEEDPEDPMGEQFFRA